MSDWQPIETAPRDGTVVLGWNKLDGILVYRPVTYGSNNQFAGWNAEYDGEGVADEPTQWMPLPPPPQTPST